MTKRSTSSRGQCYDHSDNRCGYFDGNEKSRRAQEKCGFTYHHTDKDVYLTLTNDIRTAHVTRLTREEWEKA